MEDYFDAQASTTCSALIFLRNESAETCSVQYAAFISKDTLIPSFSCHSVSLYNKCLIGLHHKRDLVHVLDVVSFLPWDHGTHRHYENTPIQVYRKFHLQKLNIFR